MKLLVFFLVGASLVRVAYLLACPYDLTGPEAIAWDLSRRIGETGSRAWMLPSSWLIAAGTALLGDTELGVAPGRRDVLPGERASTAWAPGCTGSWPGRAQPPCSRSSR